ncbi:hypothetical protein TorRG33x02_043490 [Trema orientale]|uniref:Uncharacterized protein n=1 Tax=Trema orientale TaxID=63057 RepID=A0A2P5FQ48_TREOI|nr:hypothetical protein TorRG33x02_043490 [Trema orientale]
MIRFSRILRYEIQQECGADCSPMVNSRDRKRISKFSTSSFTKEDMDLIKHWIRNCEPINLRITQPQPATLNASTSSFSLLPSRLSLTTRQLTSLASAATRYTAKKASSSSPESAIVSLTGPFGRLLTSHFCTSPLHLCTSYLAHSPRLSRRDPDPASSLAHLPSR